MAQTIRDVACQRCGCVCDDLVVHVEENRIASIENVCPWGEAWLTERQASETLPAQARGKEVSLAEAIAQAAALLKKSRMPLVCNASECGVDTQRAAIELAELVGGVMDPAGCALHEASTLAFQTVGQSAATLGELRNRADLFVFWRGDPVVSHPRFLERFVDATGTFVPGGRTDRQVIVVDCQRTATAEFADHFLEVPAGGDLAAVASLRSFLRETPGSDTTIPEIARLAEAMKNCRYGVICIGDGVGTEPGARQVVEGLHQLVRELNAQTRFVVQSMGGPSTSEVLTWQTGFPMAVSFSTGYPRYQPGEFSAERLIERGEVDCLVLIGEMNIPGISNSARDALAEVPIIAIGTTSPGSIQAEVAIATAVDGIHRAAVTFRMDEVALPLRAVLDSPLPSQAEVVRDICEAFQR